jgi:hypothetical protein
MAAAFRMFWVGRPPAPGYHGRGVDLAEGELPVVRTWKLGRDPTVMRRQEPEMPAVVQVQPTQRRVEERRPTTRTFTAGDQGIWLDGQRIADIRASGLRMLLAVLWKTAQDAAVGQSPREARTSRKLASMIDPRLKEQSVYGWVSRIREHLGEVFPNQLDELIVSHRTKGYRLGDNVVCVGFDLSREIAGFEEVRKRGRCRVRCPLCHEQLGCAVARHRGPLSGPDKQAARTGAACNLGEICLSDKRAIIVSR